MKGRLGDKIRLQYIYDAILEIESYLMHKDFDDFSNNSMMKFACVKQMEIIGEASKHVSDEIKSRFSSVEWSQIVGMRNVFVHEYFGIDTDLVWEIIKNDLPEFKKNVKQILDTFA